MIDAENKTVYCLLTNWVYEGESGSDIEVYATLEAADEAFRRAVEEERKEDHLYDLDDHIEEVDFEEHTFTVYEEGYFGNDNFQMCVVEREIKE